MMRRWAFLGLLAVLGGLSFGELAWGLSLQNPAFAWPLVSRHEFWMGGTLLGLAWVLFVSAGWRLAFNFSWLAGARAGAVGILAGLPAWLWPHFARPILPHPHDLAVESLQLLAAGLGIGGLLLSLGTGLAILARGPGRDWPVRSLCTRLFGVLWLFFTLCGAWSSSWHSTGDDVHYVLMAHSLVRYGTLDMAQGFQHHDYRLFYDRELTPQYPPVNGHLYTEHKAGLAVVAAPGYALAGAPGVQWVQAAWAAGLAALTLAFMLRSGLEREESLIAWAGLSFSAPVWLHSTAIYPELPGGLLLLWVFGAGAELCAPFWGIVGLAGLPWMSVRFYPLIGVAALVLAWKWRQRPLQALAVLGLPFLSLLGGLWLNRIQFGAFSPVAAYKLNKGAGAMGTLFHWDRMFQQGAGMLLDQEVGLLVFAPWFLLAVPGALAWWRRSKASLAWALILLAPYLVPVLAYYDWYGVMAPARYLVCLVPFLAMAAAQADARVLPWPGRPLLLAWTLAAGALQAILPWLAYSGFDGHNRLLAAVEARLGLPLTRYLPSFIIPNAAAWVSVLALAIVVALLWRRQLQLQGSGSALSG